jgi:PmbA protein
MDIEHAVTKAVGGIECEDVDAFEVVGMATESLAIESKRQLVDKFQRSFGQGVAIKAVSRGRVGFSSTRDLDIKSILKAVSQAMAAVKVSSESESAIVASEEDPVGEFAEQVGRSFAEIADEEKIALAMKLESAAIAHDSRIKRVRAPRYEEITMHMVVMNSNGVAAKAKRGLVMCDVRAVAEDGADVESGYEFAFSPRFEDLDVEVTARAASERAIRKLGAKSAGAGMRPVVFENKAAAAMLSLLSPSFFADNIEKGKSAISGEMGREKYSRCVTIVDDGLLPGGFSSFPFDGEGVPMRKKLMVEGGKIVGWLYDSAKAAKASAKSTGNCRRDHLFKVPSIGVTNCFLKPGPSAVEDIISAAKNGVLITDLMGLHTANTISGDFSLGAEGFLIEDGVTSAPFRGMTVSGNVHDLFSRVAAIGSDLRFTGPVGSPCMLVEGLMMGG